MPLHALSCAGGGHCPPGPPPAECLQRAPQRRTSGGCSGGLQPPWRREAQESAVCREVRSSAESCTCALLM
eukprot:2504878-Alexandrium_andersonii.AAC.1